MAKLIRLNVTESICNLLLTRSLKVKQNKIL